MAKPIFIIRLMSGISYEQRKYTAEHASSLLSDYHVLVVPDNGKTTEFECFYEKDMDEVKFEELKQIVTDHLNKQGDEA